jgi:retinol-binding protein 3
MNLRLLPAALPLALLLSAAAPQPDAAPVAFSAQTRADVLSGVDKALGDYTFPELVPKLRAALSERRAAYLTLEDPQAFAAAVTTDLYATAHDKHLRLTFRPGGFPNFGAPSPSDARIEQASDLYFNFDFVQVARLGGNIGYLKMNGFPSMPGAKATIDGALGFLANTDALIVDLRENHGGDPDSLDYMMGYFLAKPTELTSIVWNTPKHKGVDRQFSAATVSGKRYGNKPIYVLTSAMTFSCAEQFTYDMKALHRAVVIGETTGGGANPGDFYRVDARFALFVPQGHALNPYTHANWEGTGIAPDVASTAKEALLTAYTQALGIAADALPDSVQMRAQVLKNPQAELAKVLPQD